ncbi:4'-phosphopantetheinyl transferase superfamily protein [Modestobacter sp. I12A-02628]|uniref:4'-phosphopantetheinyl transferase superfamily protein n=1 Tax=Goekera deserti TaxID=2497753 RepID=A0A7K3WDH3_9ACTN|nr:4'-phosphopantetheinyl transferase superfamily protein [Goekera deserti]MPQ96880.1 4'-phosphopantetheinyl transferase superfamily protein [Goekera deserti]NDI46807.1 4'-phosphopantetheinyl transferase superfamily protein [Goekera deserti]NEL54376.1 4'-phosphopantetheinyl transferase superfamily protein [Goekera deserti]
MLEELLPPAVLVVEAFQDGNASPLFPEEEAVVARAVERRRLEFTTVRSCARQALARLGAPAGAILPGEKGAPIWPPGVVGSMTHCAGYRGSAVARAAEVVTVGIDAEENAPLPRGVLPLVSLPEERAQLERLALSRPDVCWDRLLFSMKESVYKAWFPLTGRWLGFEEATVSAEATTNTFSARLLVPGPMIDGREVTGFQGRWLARDGLVLTAIATPATGPLPEPRGRTNAATFSHGLDDVTGAGGAANPR